MSTLQWVMSYETICLLPAPSSFCFFAVVSFCVGETNRVLLSFVSLESVMFECSI